MAEPRAKFIDGMKFMWDGQEYESVEAAGQVAEEYQTHDFETRVVEEGGKVFLYTRRVVTEVVVEGDSPG